MSNPASDDDAYDGSGAAPFFPLIFPRRFPPRPPAPRRAHHPTVARTRTPYVGYESLPHPVPASRAFPVAAAAAGFDSDEGWGEEGVDEGEEGEEGVDEGDEGDEGEEAAADEARPRLPRGDVRPLLRRNAEARQPRADVHIG